MVEFSFTLNHSSAKGGYNVLKSVDWSLYGELNKTRSTVDISTRVPLYLALDL